jgi:sugar O-acyltransferase (sialic acid O-acetyltransferase NeuD family)
VESHLSIIVANGNPVSRADLIFKLQQNNLDNLLTSIISPRAYISPTAQIERGVVVCTGSLVSVNAKIEENSVVYHQSLVGHGAKIQKNCFISSMVNIAGNVKIGANTFIGMGALIREGVTIGHDVVIGMGSVVTKDIPDGMLAYGNPARVVRNSSQGNLYRKE